MSAYDEESEPLASVTENLSRYSSDSDLAWDFTLTEQPSVEQPSLAADTLPAAPVVVAPSALEPAPYVLAQDPGPAPIVDPTPVGDAELLGIVRVVGAGGLCTGMLIADDRVLTAAHCFCTWDYAGSNTCDTEAEVIFRQDPAGPELSESLRRMVGTATVHAGYNPSWVDREIENDLAVIDLISTAPAYVTRFKLAETNLPSGAQVKIAGYGLTGDDCDGASGTLNQDLVCISEYVDDSKIIQFNDRVFCKGDSGGPVLNTAGDTIYGVHSGYWFTVAHGTVAKSIATAPYRSWLRDLTCGTELESRCDDKGPICRCAQGLGDCDSNSDCRAGLSCAQDVGASFGFPADTDVCVAPGPLEGTCGCGNSGLGNVCTASYDSCSAGFAPQCTPAMGSNGTGCGGCSCQ